MSDLANHPRKPYSCSRCGAEGHTRRSLSCTGPRDARLPYRHVLGAHSCSRCGAKGHTRRSLSCTGPRDVRLPYRRKQVTGTYHCSHCGQPGHNRRNCPPKVAAARPYKTRANSLLHSTRIYQIMASRDRHETFAEIAARHGVSRQRVHQLVRKYEVALSRQQVASY